MTDRERPTPALSVEELRADIESGDIDTVIVALTDLQGRLAGKRIHAAFFLDEVLAHGTDGCNYLLAVDVDMNTVDGYAISSWDTGYGDLVMKPDLSTLRRVPWQPGAALVLADVLHVDGSPVTVSPRQVLERQLGRLIKLGLAAFVGTELEFIVFDDGYEDAWDAGYRNLTPSSSYNVDYSILGGSRVEPLLRQIRLAMAGAGLTVESAKGECNRGQHEIAFRYAEAMTTCDNHVVYKTGAKDIAAAHGKSITFMAKFDEREGNSCHIHLSFRGSDGAPVMASDADRIHGLSPLGRSFIAGQLEHLADLTLLFAPNINSYKRFVEGSFAPTAVAWGADNRTCALRLVGRGHSLRLENRMPGGDVNPYLAVAGMIAAGVDGIERRLELGPAFVGNAYATALPRVPSNLGEAAARWSSSKWVAETFGPDVVDHYANMARVELDAFAGAVTDWERYRCFERL